MHIQECAIKLNTASVARGACVTVITTLFWFSLLYHSEEVASGTVKLLIFKWVKTY